MFLVKQVSQQILLFALKTHHTKCSWWTYQKVCQSAPEVRNFHVYDC